MDLSKDEYLAIFNKALEFVENGIPNDALKNKVIATIFLQPSTRTMTAFQSAAIRAGGGWIGTTDKNSISISKGETLEDTIRTYSSFADLIALRHEDDNSAEVAAANSMVPIINCGAGSREHAIGAAMILFNIFARLRSLSGKKIGIYGTPAINRICHAMIPIMGFFEIDLYIDDLNLFPVDVKILETARNNGIKNITIGRLDESIADLDVLVVTRGLQKGIFKEGEFSKEKEEEILKTFRPISLEILSKMKNDALVEMIPPRIFEIDTEVDNDPRAIYSQKIYYAEVILAMILHLI